MLKSTYTFNFSRLEKLMNKKKETNKSKQIVILTKLLFSTKSKLNGLN